MDSTEGPSTTPPPSTTPVIGFCRPSGPVITVLTTREPIQPPPQQKVEAKADFSNLLKNGPWIAMFILTLAHFLVLAMRGGTLFYYFQYFVNQDRLFELLQSLGLTNASSYLLNVAVPRFF